MPHFRKVSRKSTHLRRAACGVGSLLSCSHVVFVSGNTVRYGALLTVHVPWAHGCPGHREADPPLPVQGGAVGRPALPVRDPKEVRWP